MNVRFCRAMAMFAVGSIATAGCASSIYVPQDRCLLHTVHVDGRPHYFLNGQAYKAPIVGDIHALTHGVPKAQQYAAEAESAATTFAVMYGAGLATMLVSPLPLFVGDTPAIRATNPQILDLGLAGGLFVLGTALAYGSFYQMSKAFARRQDAINAYNDHVKRTGDCLARGALNPPRAATATASPR